MPFRAIVIIYKLVCSCLVPALVSFSYIFLFRFLSHRNRYPFCQTSYRTWRPRGAVRFNILKDRPEKNPPKNPKSAQEVDRHDCVALDVNRDGIDDIICMAGAKNWGKGLAYNELCTSSTDRNFLFCRCITLANLIRQHSLARGSFNDDDGNNLLGSCIFVVSHCSCRIDLTKKDGTLTKVRDHGLHKVR